MSDVLDPRRLAALVVVARTGSLTAAAEELGMTQPGVGYHLRALEAQLGTQLIVRAGRGVRLTDAGKTLERRARPILTALSAAQGELASLVVDLMTKVTVAAFGSAIDGLLANLINEVQADREDLEDTETQATGEEAYKLVSSGGCDLALVLDQGSTPTSGLTTRPMAEVGLYAVLDQAHPLTKAKQVRPRDLAGERLIFVGEEVAGLLRARFPEVESQAQVTHVVADRTAALALARTPRAPGILLMLLFDDALPAAMAAEPSMNAVRLSPKVTVPVLAVWQRGIEPTAGTQTVMTRLGVG